MRRENGLSIFIFFFCFIIATPCSLDLHDERHLKKSRSRPGHHVYSFLATAQARMGDTSGYCIYVQGFLCLVDANFFGMQLDNRSYFCSQCANHVDASAALPRGRLTQRSCLFMKRVWRNRGTIYAESILLSFLSFFYFLPLHVGVAAPISFLSA